MENLFEDCELVVLTRGRTDNQKFLLNLPPEMLGYFTIVCHPGEKLLLEKDWKGLVKNIVEYDGNNVGEARQWVIENIPGKYVIFFDDNLQFHTRVDWCKPDFGNVPKFGLSNMTFSKFTNDHLFLLYIDLINNLYTKLKEGFGMCGISHRTGNNRVAEDFVENTRFFGLLAVNKESYKHIGATFADVSIREDFYVALNFLLHGIKIGSFYNYAIDKKTSNDAGGCSFYRTADLLRENAFDLEKKYPGIVKAVVKNKTWKGIDSEIVDVIIYWKKAYALGVSNVKV